MGFSYKLSLMIEKCSYLRSGYVISFRDVQSEVKNYGSQIIDDNLGTYMLIHDLR